MRHCPTDIDEVGRPERKCSFNEHECNNEQLELNNCISLTNIYDNYLDDCNETYFNRQIYFYNGTDHIN
jgi:hypothetical protein